VTLQRATIASLATLALGLSVTGWTIGSSGLLSKIGLFVFSPYAVLCGACFLADSSRGRAIATLVVCILATAWAIYCYGDIKHGLVFLLVPGLQLPVAILLLIVVFFTRPRSRAPAGATLRVDAPMEQAADVASGPAPSANGWMRSYALAWFGTYLLYAVLITWINGFSAEKGAINHGAAALGTWLVGFGIGLAVGLIGLVFTWKRPRWRDFWWTALVVCWLFVVVFAVFGPESR
jgi:hypothetical protein